METVTELIESSKAVGHTPGPWKVYAYEETCPDGQFQCGIETDYPPALCNGTRSIAYMTGCALTKKGSAGRQAEINANLANARLIAAAPDFLAGACALLDACNWDDVIEVGGKPMRHALCLLQAAVDKAAAV